MQLRLLAYSIASSLLPRAVVQRLATAAWTRRLRDVLLRDGSSPRYATGDIRDHGVDFSWTAPIQTMSRAQRRGGIENRICRAIRANCPAAGTAIDIGANYGFITMVMARTVGADGRVLAVEADSPVCRVLDQTMSRNAASHVEVIEAFAGSIDRPADGKVSIDGLCARQQLPRVDVVKIDVDGPDFDVLVGARQTLLDNQPLVIVEMSNRQREIHALLKECGYSQLLDMSGEPVDADGPWPPNMFAWTRPIERFVP